jgi:hypothetical protein
MSSTCRQLALPPLAPPPPPPPRRPPPLRPVSSPTGPCANPIFTINALTLHIGSLYYGQWVKTVVHTTIPICPLPLAKL